MYILQCKSTKINIQHVCHKIDLIHCALKIGYLAMHRLDHVNENTNTQTSTDYLDFD